MFVFGKSISPGISGTNVDLSEAVSANNYQIKTVQHDYRRVFSTILQDWFGVNNSTLDLTFYNKTTQSGYTNAKITNLMKSQNTVPSSCYTNKVLGLEDFEIKNEVIVYPNPSSEIINVHSQNNIKSVTIYAMDGRSVITYINPLPTNESKLNVSNLSVGIYNLKINTEKGVFSKKIIIRR